MENTKERIDDGPLVLIKDLSEIKKKIWNSQKHIIVKEKNSKSI